MFELGEYRRVDFSGAYDTGDCLYASHGLFNGLLKLNKETGCATYEKKFLSESSVRKGMGMHGRVFRYGDELIFTPDVASGLHFYNPVSGTMEYYQIDSGSALKSRCIDAFLDDDILWLFFSHVNEAIVVFDLKTKTQKQVWSIQEKLPSEIKERNLPVFNGCLQRIERKIYGAIWGSCYLVEFDLDKMVAQIYKPGDESLQLTGVACDGESFWMTMIRSTSVMRWQPRENVLTEYVSNLQADSKALTYCNIICYDNEVFVIPNLGKEVLCIDKGNKCLIKFCELPDNMQGFADVRKSWRRFFFYDICAKDILRLYPVGVDMMLDINLKTAEVQGYRFELDESWNDDKYREVIIYDYLNELSSKQYFAENKEVALDEYLDFVTKTELENKEDSKTTIGVDIWMYVNEKR